MNHKTLPPNYRYAGTMDFTRNRKQIIAMLKLALALLIVPLLAGLILHPPRPSWRGFLETWPLWAAMVGMQIIYIPLHELTHGLAMYALSGVKPSYGLKLPYAYTGSTVWFDRQGRTIVNGEPFFPLGMYWGGWCSSPTCPARRGTSSAYGSYPAWRATC